MRRSILACLIPCVALLAPAVADAASVDEARHLLARTGFDVNPEVLARLTSGSYERAVNQLLDGWTVNPKSGEFRVNRRQHDGGAKTFLGRNGNFDGDDIVDIVLQQPRTAEFITEKLWREFISGQPDTQEIKRLARIFRDSGYRIRPLMSALLTTSAFRDRNNRGTLIKSPVELLVGTIRQLRIPLADERGLVRAGIFLGQDLFDPPNVKGWPGGLTWITSSSLLARYQVLERLLRGAEADPKHGVAMSVATIDESDPQQLKPLLLPLEPVNPVAMGNSAVAIRGWILNPVYQLK